jgi:hypothetical protein
VTRTPSASAAIPDEDKPLEPYRPPVMDAKRMTEIDAAVAAHARAHNSDPFAGARVRAHLRRGLCYVSDVLADANQQLVARDAARAAAVVPE